MGVELVGRVLEDRLRIDRPLGRGGMGEVYLATRLDLGQPAAVKVMWADPRRAEGTVGRFHREGEALARLRHPSIVRVEGHGETEDGLLYLVMEYVRGPNLESRVEANGPLPLAQALSLLRQLAEGVAYAHGEGIVHRDLKPSNVVLPEDVPGTVKIIDFGLARIISDHTLTVITTANAAVGTPLYMAPEQFLAGEVGPAADVYGLAGLAYFALAGRPVFPVRSKTQVVLAHCRKSPPPLSEICPGLVLPDGVETLLLRCLAKSPTERPRAVEVARALEALEGALCWDAATSVTSRSALAAHSRPTDSEELGELIWSDSDVGRSLPLGVSRDRFVQEGLQNQITNLLVEISLSLTAQSPAARDLRQRVADIEAIRGGIGELEIDLALLDSDRGQPAAMPDGREDGSCHRLATLTSELEDRQRRLNLLYRSLFAELQELRSPTDAPGLSRLFSELDGLVQRFVEASSG